MTELSRRPGRATAKQRNVHATEYLAFTLAGDTYAAPVSFVREILAPRPLTPVPRAPDATMGIVSVRGQLVTVLDLRRRMRLTAGPQTRRTRILLVDATRSERLGLYVDEVQQVYPVAEGEIEQAATALGGDVASYIAGIARPEAKAGSVIILLDLQAILAT